MNTAEYQTKIIDKLDKVVAGAEALMMDERARTTADFGRLKSEIQGLLEVVTAFERMCHGENSLQSVKQTIAALKRTVETERASVELEPSAVFAGTVSADTRETAVPGVSAAGLEATADEDEGLSFGFEVLPTGAETSAEAAADVPFEATADAVSAAVPAAVEKPKSIEPELGLRFDDEPESEPEPSSEPVAASGPKPAGEPEPEAEFEAAPASVAVTSEPEPVAAPAASADVLMQPNERSGVGADFDVAQQRALEKNEIFEAIKQETLAQFSVREEDQPQSYITQLTAMAQAQVKPGEQDMSGVAVSSTARPDAAPEPVSSGDSLMESLRSTRANLHGGQLRTMVDKFKAPQTIYDIQHTRTVDLKMAIGVNEKYLLTQELFAGNVKEYGEAVGRLNDAKDTAAAMAVWQALSAQRGWDENSLAYATFYDLLKRRFPDLA